MERDEKDWGSQAGVSAVMLHVVYCIPLKNFVNMLN